MSEPTSRASSRLVERAQELAQRWADEAAAHTPEPQQARLTGLLRDAAGRRFALDIADGVIRQESLGVAASQLRRSALDVPPSLPWYVRGAVLAGAGVAPMIPAPVVPIARRMLREVFRPLVLDGRPAKLGAALERLELDGIRLDLSLLGENVLGEGEARRRLDGIHGLLRREDVGQVSLTVRSVVGQASPWAFDELVEEAAERLAPLCLTASTRGSSITLDVQEHRDLDLTIAVFTHLLEDPRLSGLAAGIVLPTSLPDALPALQELTAWAQDRVDRGGAPLTVRLARGPHLAQERTEAALHGWTPAAYDSEAEADAALMRCLDWALRPERTRAVRIGVGGHDLGIAAYTWLLAQDRAVADAVVFDLAHGCEPGRLGVVGRETGSVLLRVPVAAPADVDIAIGQWLRLLEAYEPPGDGAGERLAEALHRSSDPSLHTGPRRTQNRLAPVHESVRPVVQTPMPEEQLTKAVLGITRGSVDQSFLETAVYSARELEADAGGAPGFVNTPDTDPSLPANREWARAIVARVAAASTADTQRWQPAFVEPDDAHRTGAERIAVSMREAGARWGSRPAFERSEILLRAAAALEARRGELIEIAASETGLLLAEGDAEVSHSVDCARYYAVTARELDSISGAAFVPAALTAVLPSWRAPLAEPSDGVLAALAAGSAVALVPDPRACRTATALVDTLWRAGVPREALALVNGERTLDLIAHKAVDRVILSGSRETAIRLRELRPGLPLLAETVGTNAVVVTASADLDGAVSDIVRSAFSRAGQASAAASLVILVGSAGRSKRFARQLADAARSMKVGWPSDPRAQVGPLIDRPQGAAAKVLTGLHADEEWLVRPRLVDGDPTGRLWSPGIRIGVRAESPSTRASQDVPVLTVAYAPTLEKAIELQNGAGHGLVAGLHTRDPEELALWLDRVEAGSLFVNREVTGAMVQRQPAGGWNGSSLGPGAKSGGPNRLIGLGSWRAQRTAALSSTLHLRGLDSRITALIEAAQSSLDYEGFEGLRRAALSDAIAWDREFGQVRDVSKLGIERNLLRYRPVPVEIRVAAEARLHDLLRIVIAAVRAGSPFVLSLSAGLPAGVRHALAELQAAVYLESDDEWIERGLRRTEGVEGTAAAPRSERVRLVGAADTVAALRARLIDATDGSPDISIFDGEVTSAGRIELLAFVREQSISVTAHRHGIRDDWSAAVI
ncbi:MAG: proline dehydrogenase family protein [Microbacterium sp.]